MKRGSTLRGHKGVNQPCCPRCGWIVTDDYVFQLAAVAERGTGLQPSYLAVRCPECQEPVPGLVDVQAARSRVHHAHDDLGDGGVCTKCGRLHTAVLVPACERCGGPDWSKVPDGPVDHHHCPPLLLVEMTKEATG